ncbi:MAG: hypothetical protein IJR13_07525 [Bacteroidales bacterium]|nr:hypothetical protein [Bacteroidales bacterium]
MAVFAMTFSFGTDCAFAQASPEVEIQSYCQEFESDASGLRGRGIGTSSNQQMSRNKARAAALEELGGKIQTELAYVMENNMEAFGLDEDDDVVTLATSASTQIVKQSIKNFKTICEKFTAYQNEKGKKIYKCYMALEFSLEQVEKGAFDVLKSEGKLAAGETFDKFRNKYGKTFKEGAGSVDTPAESAE